MRRVGVETKVYCRESASPPPEDIVPIPDSRPHHLTKHPDIIGVNLKYDYRWPYKWNSELLLWYN